MYFNGPLCVKLQGVQCFSGLSGSHLFPSKLLLLAIWSFRLVLHGRNCSERPQIISSPNSRLCGSKFGSMNFRFRGSSSHPLKILLPTPTPLLPMTFPDTPHPTTRLPTLPESRRTPRTLRATRRPRKTRKALESCLGEEAAIRAELSGGFADLEPYVQEKILHNYICCFIFDFLFFKLLWVMFGLRTVYPHTMLYLKMIVLYLILGIVKPSCLTLPLSRRNV